MEKNHLKKHREMQAPRENFRKLMGPEEVKTALRYAKRAEVGILSKFRENYWESLEDGGEKIRLQSEKLRWSR